jgi:hypothetical protein
MRAGVFMALATAVLGGCTAQMSTWLGSNQQPTTWLRLDKQQIVGNADLERQFAADEATCQGEVSKADTSSALSVHSAEEAIYRGCMSRRGYYERQ